MTTKKATATPRKSKKTEEATVVPAAPVKAVKAAPVLPSTPAGILTEEALRAMPEDDYMNEAQLAFFRHRLLAMRLEVTDREVGAKERLGERETFADPADRATAEEEHWLDLRLRERESYLLKKIDESLKRIRDKSYGWCEKSGDPIGLPRLLARPTATVCVDIKGLSEKVETHFRDR
jgi:DnaK suppressor protein